MKRYNIVKHSYGDGTNSTEVCEDEFGRFIEYSHIEHLMKTFDEYWDEYGELLACLCNGDIKKFASSIWQSAICSAGGLKDEKDMLK